MVSQDRNNTIKDPNDCVSEEQYILLKNYFRDIGDVRKAMLVHTLWRTGRRISEIVGSSPYNPRHRMHGLRVQDINFERKMIKFAILKKNPINKKDKQGKDKPEEKLVREHIDKEGKYVWKKYDLAFIRSLKYYITNHKDKIDHNGRLFPFHRSYVDEFLKAASIKLGTYLPIIKKYKVLMRDSDGEVLREFDGSPRYEYKKLNRPIHAHSFRHGFATHFIEKAGDSSTALLTLQELLGHSDIKTTQGYVDIASESERKILNNVFDVDEEKFKDEEEM